jgi:hypothetical protein
MSSAYVCCSVRASAPCPPHHRLLGTPFSSAHLDARLTTLTRHNVVLAALGARDPAEALEIERLGCEQLDAVPMDLQCACGARRARVQVGVYIP